MKLISSVVRPERVDGIRRALANLQVLAMTATEVRDYDSQNHETTVWRGHLYNLGYSFKMQIGMVVHDDDVDRVVHAIVCSARTGEAGDGYISVLPVEHRYSIRSGAREVS